MDVTFWILAVVILALVEFGTLALVSVWFVAGGLAALIAALFGAPFWLQMVLFVTVSGAENQCGCPHRHPGPGRGAHRQPSR